MGLRAGDQAPAATTAAASLREQRPGWRRWPDLLRGFGIRRDRPIASARQTRRACQHRSLRQAPRRPRRSNMGRRCAVRPGRAPHRAGGAGVPCGLCRFGRWSLVRVRSRW